MYAPYLNGTKSFCDNIHQLRSNTKVLIANKSKIFEKGNQG